MVALPVEAGVIVTVVPLIDAVATLGALDDGLPTVPFALFTVNVLVLGNAVLPLVALSVIVHAALPMVQVYEPVFVVKLLAVTL